MAKYTVLCDVCGNYVTSRKKTAVRLENYDDGDGSYTIESWCGPCTRAFWSWYTQRQAETGAGGQSIEE